MNLDEIVHEKLTLEGVTPITQGAVVCATVRENLRNLLKLADPKGYARYKAIKYPNGEGSDTDHSRLAATSFLFDRARDLLLPHYVSTKATTESESQ